MKNNELILFLNKNGFNLSNWEEIPMKSLNSRKKMTCLFGLSNKKSIAIFANFGKSRVLKKDIEILQDLSKKLENLKHLDIENKIYILNAPICSKALLFAKKDNWKVLHVSL